VLRTVAPLLLALLALSCGGADDAGDEAPVTGTTAGVIVEVTDQQITLAPDGGGEPERFAVRPIDARRLDLFHLAQHAQARWPVRVVWRAVDGIRYAERVDDA
jgi:hypothetical protein